MQTNPQGLLAHLRKVVPSLGDTPYYPMLLMAKLYGFKPTALVLERMSALPDRVTLTFTLVFTPLEGGETDEVDRQGNLPGGAG